MKFIEHPLSPSFAPSLTGVKSCSRSRGSPMALQIKNVLHKMPRRLLYWARIYAPATVVWASCLVINIYIYIERDVYIYIYIYIYMFPCPSH